MKRPKNRRGYTLTEMLLVVAILGIISSLGPLLLNNMQNFYLMTTARNDIQRDARAALDVMNRFVRQGKQSTITIDNGTGGGGPYSRIRFKHVDGRYVEFRQSASNLLQTVNATTTILSKNLIYVAFTFPRTDDPSIVSISLTMGKSIQLGRRKVLELTIQKVRVMN